LGGGWGNGDGGSSDATEVAKKAKPAPKDEEKPEEKDPAKKKKAAPEESAGPPPTQIVYDMRKLIAERLRSEAGAMVSAGASSAEASRLNAWNTKQAQTELVKVNARTAQASSILEGGVAAVEAAKVTAEEAERKTGNLLKESHVVAASMIAKVKKLTKAAIEKAIEPCVKTAAETRATGKHLDKPDDWMKVVAARAANPYQAAVTGAVQRVDEYSRMANGLHSRALAAIKQANFLMPHASIARAHGDVIEAANQKKQATNLLLTAKSLQAEAQGYWDTANAASMTIPKWQNAAAQAAAYAAWEYKANEQAFAKIPGQ